MSFKLVDNPGSGANKIKQLYRIKELLESNLPSTEYMVNRSGKYACIVCSHWPVFDTLAMLSKHRNGTKHQGQAESWNKEKLNKILLSEKLQQKDFIKRSAIAREDDKHKLDNISANNAPLLKKARTLVDGMQSGISSFDGSALESQPPTECTISTNICIEQNENNSKIRKDRTPFFQSIFDIKTSDTVKLKTIAAVIKKTDSRPDFSLNTSKSKHPSSSNSVRESNVNSSSASSKGCLLTHGLKTTEKSRNKRSCSSDTAHQIVSSEDNKKQKEYSMYYTKMRQNGWIKNDKGEWIKDEECEFDSDEEPDEYRP